MNNCYQMFVLVQFVNSFGSNDQSGAWVMWRIVIGQLVIPSVAISRQDDLKLICCLVCSIINSIVDTSRSPREPRYCCFSQIFTIHNSKVLN